MKVFVIPFHVKHMNDGSSIMPSGFAGGYVNCYSPGEDYGEATERALKSLISNGIYPEEILQPIGEMDLENWSQHVSDKWPELKDSLHSQNEFESAMIRGEVVYGPFGMYM